ncbi:MAG: exo-beta-N-acetylmuramidase NamZ domain-containing protein [Bradymonadia bacterium]
MHTHTSPAVATGLDLWVEEGFSALRGQRVGVVCHAASVDAQLVHVLLRMKAAGVNVTRCFGPEHGIWADAQDMIAVAEVPTERITGAELISLYGDTPESLQPKAEHLADLDVLVVDLQDVGARYYTYIYTAALCAQAAAKVGVPVVILDRPNPIGGAQVEGGLGDRAYASFVGMWPLPIRHGLTIGEVVTLLDAREGFGADITVVKMRGWQRSMYFDETGLPWVQPSPNMPTVETAVVYPGMCLIEGTLMNEGRGTTRPFELIGADYVDPFAVCEALSARPVEGIVWRPVWYRPTFHKFGGQTIGGVALHVRDRSAFQPWRAGLHFLSAVQAVHGEALRWRTERYEYVSDRLAIDLLCGGTTVRETIEAGGDIDAVWQAGEQALETFLPLRSQALLYPEQP